MKPLKILHINHNKEYTYFLLIKGLFIRSKVPRKEVKKFLKVVKPDLVLNGPSEFLPGI
jgi:hypothetical protein